MGYGPTKAVTPALVEAQGCRRIVYFETTSLDIVCKASKQAYTPAVITFDEPRVSALNYLDPPALYQLIVCDLCGEKYHRQFNETDRTHLSEFVRLTSDEGLTYGRFNELLLLLEQDRVSEAFYKFFFSDSTPLKLQDLPKCVIKFRGYAMLCYGNFLRGHPKPAM